MKKTKWLIYTVIIGLIPLFIRLLIFVISIDKSISYIFNEVDLIVFGLVLHLTNINELEDKQNIDKHWKTKFLGFSVIMLIMFSAFLGLTYFSENDKSTVVNRTNIKICAGFLCIISFIMSYAIYNRLNKIANE